MFSPYPGSELFEKLKKEKKLSVDDNYFRKLIKIKNGDHSLSRKNDLKKICHELNLMIEDHSFLLNNF